MGEGASINTGKQTFIQRLAAAWIARRPPGPSFLNAPGFEIVDVPEMKSVFILNMAGPALVASHLYGWASASKGEKICGLTFLGHSIGHWEGDTLVIDSVGFNEKQWAFGAFPNTSQLHLTEQISRPEP